MKKLFLLAALAAGVHAQGIFVPGDGTALTQQISSVAPAGACAASYNVFDYVTGHTWGCVGVPGSRVWTDLTSGGGSVSSINRVYAAVGLCQGSVASAPLWLPTSNAPSYSTCTATNQQGEWIVPATTTAVNWGLGFVVPASVTGSWSLNLTWRTADTTTSHAVTFTPSYACVAAAGSPDNPTYTSLSTFTINPSGVASANSTATYTFTPSCAAGSQFRLLLTATANTVTSAANFSAETLNLVTTN